MNIRQITAVLSLVVFLAVFVGRLRMEPPNSGDLYLPFQWAIYTFLLILLLGLLIDGLLTLKSLRKDNRSTKE